MREEKRKQKTYRSDRNQIRTEIFCGKNHLNTKRSDNSIFILLHKGNFISSFCDRLTLMVTPVLGHQLQTISSIALLRVGVGQDIRLNILSNNSLMRRNASSNIILGCLWLAYTPLCWWWLDQLLQGYK